MAQPAAASFAAGHAAGVSADARANHTLAFAEELDHDVQVSSHVVHEFFAEFLPNLGLFFLIVLVLGLVFFVVVLAVGFLMRQCRLPENCTRLTVYVLGLIFAMVVLATAFGAVGIDFGHLLLGFGLISIAFSAGLSDAISNAVAGVLLQTTDLSELHRKIAVAGYAGEIVAMNLRHVEIRPDSKAGSAYTGDDTTILIPNAVLERSAVTVSWRGMRGGRLSGASTTSSSFAPVVRPMTTFGQSAGSPRKQQQAPPPMNPQSTTAAFSQAGASLGALEGGIPYTEYLKKTAASTNLRHRK